MNERKPNVEAIRRWVADLIEATYLKEESSSITSRVGGAV